MLSVEDICERLTHAPGHTDRLSIVPRPDLAGLRERGGTSIDLRLGRWFRSFKPSKSSEAKLWHEEPPAAVGGQFAGIRATTSDDARDRDASETSLATDDALPAEHEWAQPARDAVRTAEHFVPFGDNFILHPGRFVLGVTLEWLTLPRSLSGYVSGKSSLGRHGLVIETAAGLHPGFSGCLTLELANVGEVPVAISPGMEICQIFLHRVTGCGGGHAGTFSGQRKPGISLPKPDPIFNKLRAKGGAEARGNSQPQGQFPKDMSENAALSPAGPAID